MTLGELLMWQPRAMWGGNSWHVTQRHINPLTQLLRPRSNTATVVGGAPPQTQKPSDFMLSTLASTSKMSSRWVSKNFFKIEPRPPKTSECRTGKTSLLFQAWGREGAAGRESPLGSSSPRQLGFQQILGVKTGVILRGVLHEATHKL